MEKTSKQLAEDAATLTRVRNRFAHTTDAQLPKVMSGLIPRLFQRLEEYSQPNIMVVNPRGTAPSSCASSPVTANQMKNPESMLDHNQTIASSSDRIGTYKKRAQEDIFGILSNAMERLKGNPTLPTTTLISALLPFLRSHHPVVCTWALAFLQVCLPRGSVESMDRTTIARLIESLAGIHHELVSGNCFLREISNDVDDDDPIPPSVMVALEARWSRVSWLLLDSIMVYSGHRPLVDWDVETFDPHQTHSGGQCLPASPRTQHPHDNNQMALLEEAVKAIHPQQSADSKVNRTLHGLDGGTAILDLLLDLILYWPDEASSSLKPALSASGLTRMAFRTTISSNEFGDELEQEEDRVRRWHDQHPHPPAVFGRRVRPRSLVPSKWSDASKAYLRYLKLACFKFAVWNPEGSLFQNGHQTDRALLLSILAANDESMHGREATLYLNRRNGVKGTAPVPVSVATSILILTLGEAAASPILDQFEGRYGAVGCWELILGARTRNESLQRPALPWSVASRAGNYLLRAPLKLECDSAANEAYSTLLVELSLRLSTEGEKEYKFLSIQLLAGFLKQFQPSSSILPEIYIAIVEVLKIVADQGASDNEDLRNRSARPVQLPLGVPAPFNHRNDLNRLLHSHRQSLKSKQMKHDDAIQARMEAYKLIPRLSKLMFESENNRPFELPNLLLQCAVYEDRLLEPYVVKALDASLSECVRRHDQGLQGGSGEDETLASFQLEATSLLPSLLEVTCAELVSTRRVGIEWIAKLLVKMDSEAAFYLSSRLVHDEDLTIAKLAQDVINSNPCMDLDVDSTVSFVCMEGENRTSQIQAELDRRISEVTDTLCVSSDEATSLLLHHGFSIAKAVSAYRQDAKAIRDFCGFVNIERHIEKQEKDFDCCGICYEDMNSSSGFSLGCGHHFCDSCWNSYIVDASETCKSAALSFLDLRCPEHNCNSLVTKSHISLMAPSLLVKWNEALLQTFIELDHSYRFCPGPNCGYVAIVSLSSPLRPLRTATCEACSTSFCFQCGGSPHAPATCSGMREWNRLMGSSGFWIKQYSKPCPGCHAPIEKNTGCNHMKCSKCQTDFCWLCLAQLGRHLESHLCSQYDPADSAENDFERHALFIASRYHAHEEAEQFGLSQSSSFQPQKLMETFWFLDEDEDPETLDHALKTIVNARCFLKHSYVATLDLRNDPKRLKIHEGHHSCLEVFTERLSQLAETNLPRLYLEQGEQRVKSHFRKLAFYTISVIRYMERISGLVS